MKIMSQKELQSNQQQQKQRETICGKYGPNRYIYDGFTITFTSTWFSKKFYDGGFEDKMTKREAALILGIRESATVDRIKEAYRKLLPLNHPDRGGSAYIATKINEAKDLLF